MDTSGKGRSGSNATGMGKFGGLFDKLAAGEFISDVTVQAVLDEFSNPDLSGRQKRIVYTAMWFLLGRQLDEATMGTDIALQRMEARLRDDLRPVDGNDVALEALGDALAVLRLALALPGEALPKFILLAGVARMLLECAAFHPNSMLRAAAVAEVTDAAARCAAWCGGGGGGSGGGGSGRAFFNGGAYESGGEVQRAQQVLWDWVLEVYARTVVLCEDEDDAVAAAAFAALGGPLRTYPLCATALDTDIAVLLNGAEPAAKLDASTSDKAAFPLQQLGEGVLRAALPALPRLLARSCALGRGSRCSALRTCCRLAVAALRAGYSACGSTFIGSRLLEKVSRGGLGGRGAAAEAPAASAPPLFASVDSWLRTGVLPLLSGLDAEEVECAVFTTLRVLHAPPLRPQRALLAPAVAAAAAALLPLTAAAAARTTHAPPPPPLNAGQAALAAAATAALRWAPPQALPPLLAALVPAVALCPEPGQRLGLMAEAFFAVMVCIPGGGRANKPAILEAILESDWLHGVLNADAPAAAAGGGGGSGGGVPFREELVAALTHTCAYVLTAGATAIAAATAPSADADGGEDNGTSLASPVQQQLPLSGVGRYPLAPHAPDAAAAAAERWCDLERWVTMSGAVLHATGLCVGWDGGAAAASAGADGYTRLLALILRLTSPSAAAAAAARGGGGGGGGARALGSPSPIFSPNPRPQLSGDARLARAAAAHVPRLDQLGWKLAQGMPGRRARVALLGALCRYLADVSGAAGQAADEQEEEDAALDLVARVSVELAALDAPATSNLKSAAPPAAATAATTAAPGAAAATAAAAAERAAQWRVNAQHALLDCLVRLAAAYDSAAAPAVKAARAERDRACLRDGLGGQGNGPLADQARRAVAALEAVTRRGRASLAGGAAELAAAAAARAALGFIGTPPGLPPPAGPLSADDAARKAALRAALLGELALPPAQERDARLGGSGGGAFDYRTGAQREVAARVSRHFRWPLRGGHGAAPPPRAAWSPPMQLNGGSEPLHLTACHRLTPRWRAHNSAGGGGGGSGKGVSLRVCAYNATNGSITDALEIRLGFGAGAAPAAVPAAAVVLRDRLLPGAVYTWDVPLALAPGWRALAVTATITMLHAEPDPELEADSATELAGGDALLRAAAAKKAAAAASSSEGDLGGGSDAAAPVPLVVGAGMYVVHAEALLLPRAGGGGGAGLAAFQSLFSGLAHRTALPVTSAPWATSLCTTPAELAMAMGAPMPGDGTDDAAAPETADDLELLDADHGDDVRRAAWVPLPPALLSACDHAITAAWAFETWQGSAVTAQLTAMKQPYGAADIAAIGGAESGALSPKALAAAVAAAPPGAAAAAAHAWVGRLEFRCADAQCAETVAAHAARMAAFVTNGAFALLPAGSDVLRATSVRAPGHGSAAADGDGGAAEANAVRLWSQLHRGEAGWPGAAAVSVLSATSPLSRLPAAR